MGDPMRLAPMVEKLIHDTDAGLRLRSIQAYSAVLERIHENGAHHGNSRRILWHTGSPDRMRRNLRRNHIPSFATRGRDRIADSAGSKPQRYFSLDPS